MRRAVVGLLLSALLLFTLVPSALAYDRRAGTRLTVAAGETVEDDLLLSGVTVEVAGTVLGDVFAFADSVIVTGTIGGNLVVMGSAVDVSGQVDGTVYAMAENLNVSGAVGNSVVSVAGSTVIAREAVLGGNWIASGNQLRLEGSVGRGVLGFARSLRLDGPVKHGVEAWVDQLSLGDSAAIEGTVTYHSGREAQVSADARVGALEFIPQEPRSWGGPGLAPATGLVIRVAGFLIVGLLLLALLPNLRTRFPRAIRRYPWQAPLLGLAALVALPVGAGVLMATVVGAPLGLLTLLLYPPALYCGQVLLSWAVGRFVADRWAWLGSQHWAVIFLAGTVLTTLLTELPRVGLALSFVAVVYGLGGLLYAFRGRDGGETVVW